MGLVIEANPFGFVSPFMSRLPCGIHQTSSELGAIAQTCGKPSMFFSMIPLTRNPTPVPCLILVEYGSNIREWCSGMPPALWL
jgi:hypothetical protein